MAPFRSRFSRFLFTALAAAVFVASIAFFWWRLPPAPRFTFGGDPRMRLVAMSPDGSLLAIATETNIQLREIATGRIHSEWPISNDSVEHAVFTPDGRRLIANCFERSTAQRPPHAARIYRVGAESVEAVLPLGRWLDYARRFPEPRSFLVSPDSTCLVYLTPKGPGLIESDECLVKIWDIATARERTVLADVGNDVQNTPLAFSPDGRFVAVGISYMFTLNRVPGQVKIWESATGRLAHTLILPQDPSDQDPVHFGCVSVLFTTDGKGLVGFVSSTFASFRPRLFEWELETEILRKSRIWDNAFGSPGDSVALRLANTGDHLLIEGLERAPVAYLCDLAKPDVRVQVLPGTAPLLTHDGLRLAAQAHRRKPGPIGITPSPRAVQEPAKIMFRNVADGKESELCRSGQWGDATLTPLAFAPDDRIMAVNVHYWRFGDRWFESIVKWFLEPERSVHLFDVAGTRCLARLPGGPGTRVVFIPDGKGLIAHERGGVRVYDIPLRAPVPAILGWALLPTGIVIVLGALPYIPRRWVRPTPFAPRSGSISDGRT